MSVSPQSATAAASPGDAIPMSGAVDGDRVVTRVGRRMMWYLIALYVVSVLDRGNLSFASFSMNRQLGLTPQMYGVGVGILFLGYSLFELPSNLALARYGARVTLTRIAILFGLVILFYAISIAKML